MWGRVCLLIAFIVGFVAATWLPSKVVAATVRPLSVISASAAAGQAGPSAAASADQKVEIPALRTRTSRTYRYHGLYQAQVFPGSVHYQDSGGAWQPIDNSLVATTASGYRYTNRANRYAAYLPNRLTDAPIKFSSGSNWVSFAPVGAASVTGVAAGGKVTYAGAYPGVDMAWTALNDGLDEAILLHSAAAPSGFTYTLAMSPGLSAQVSSPGRLDFLSGGQPVFSFSAPFMSDSARPAAISHGVSLSLAGAVLTLQADAAWLASPARVWPVTIDPSTNFTADQDCEIANGSSADTNICSTSTLNVGYDGATVHRALLQFNIQNSLPSTLTVMDGSLNLYLESTPGSINVSAYQLTHSWTNSVTWNKYDGSSAWTTAGGDYATPAVATNVPPATGYASWSFTPLIQSWLRGTANDGLLVRQDSETTNQTWSFDSTRAADSSRWPYLNVTYVPQLGEAGWYKLEQTRLDDRMGIDVNLVSGDLVVRASDVAISQPGLPLNLDRIYNSLASSQNRPFGPYWFLSRGTDMFLRVNDANGPSLVGPGAVIYKFIGSGPSFTSPAGIDADLVENAGDTWTLTFHASQEKWNFLAANPDGQALISSDVDRNGNTTTYTYTSGKLTSVTGDQGSTRNLTMTYASPVDPSLISKITDWSGRQWQYSYYANLYLQTYTDPNGKATQYHYDANNLLDKLTDPRGQVTKFTYDSTARVKTVKRITDIPSDTGYTTTYNYDQATSACGTPPDGDSFQGRSDSVDANGHTTKYCFNPKGLVTRVFDGLGHERDSSYTANYNVSTLTDAVSQVTRLSYDNNNNLIQLQAPASGGGQTAASSYGSYNTPSGISGYPYLPSSATDAQGNCRAFTYNTAGNLQNVYDGQASSGAPPQCDGLTGGTHLSNAYQGDTGVDCNGKTGELCSTTDGNGNTTTYAYDGATTGNLTSITPPAVAGGIGATSITTDSLSRVSCVTDGKGQKTHYLYDSLDRIQHLYFGASSCTATDGLAEDFSYDEDGNVSSRVDNTGTTSFKYDPLNRLIDKSLPDTSIACSGSNPLGLTFAYDGPGNLTSYCDVGGTVAYGYDRANRLSALAEPGGSINPGTSTTDASCNLNPCTGMLYTDNDQRKEIDFPNSGAKWSATYDNAGNQLTAIGKDSASNVLTSFTYTYNQGTNDRQLRQTVAQADAVFNGTLWYGYDAFNRLCAVATSSFSGGCSPPAGSTTFAYDAAGNRTSLTSGGSTTYYAYNADNEICWSASSSGSCASPPAGAVTYGFDANGNLTSSSSGSGSLSYNAKDQTTAITWNSTTLSPLAYADVGQSERSQAGSVNQYSSPLGLVIDKNGSNRTYYTRDNNGNVIGERTPDGNRWYYLKDGLGSVVAVINESGGTIGDRYGYDAWGNQTSHTGTTANPWGYASGYLDSTGLIKFGTRYYDPNLGRWTQQDATSGFIEEAATLNAYLYADDNPAVFTDPGGCQVPAPNLLRLISQGLTCAGANVKCLGCCAKSRQPANCQGCCTICLQSCYAGRPCSKGDCFGCYP